MENINNTEPYKPIEKINRPEPEELMDDILSTTLKTEVLELIKSLYQKAALEYHHLQVTTAVTHLNSLLVLRTPNQQRCPDILFVYDTPIGDEQLTFTEMLDVAKILIEYDPDEITCCDTDPSAYGIEILYDAGRDQQTLWKEFIRHIEDDELENIWTTKISEGTTSAVKIIMTDYMS